MKRVRSTAIEPIEDREAWDKLIAETTKLVNKQDNAQWELIILAGTVETVYGENLIKRWADEAGLSISLARQYKWLASRGVNKAFVTKWARTDRKPNGLTYTVIREICGFCGGVDTPTALEYLAWAKEHKATGVAVRGYMFETVAPQGELETAAADFKLAMKDKQMAEGFSDYIAQALVTLVEDKPEAREAVLGTTIVSVDDLEALKAQAGIKTIEEGDAVDEARRMVTRLTSLKRYLRDNRVSLASAIEHDHELSDQVKMLIDTIADIAFELGTHRAPEFAPPPESVVEVEMSAN